MVQKWFTAELTADKSVKILLMETLFLLGLVHGRLGTTHVWQLIELPLSTGGFCSLRFMDRIHLHIKIVHNLFSDL